MIIGTAEFDYAAVTVPSNARLLSKRTVSVTGGNIGFSKVAAANVALSFGRKDGHYHAQRPEFFEDLLEDARQMHVIIHDTSQRQRRAWHTDGERFMLQTILHRHAVKPYMVDGMPVILTSARADEPSSIREALLKNSNLILRRDQHLKKREIEQKRFIDECQDLEERLEGLQAEMKEVQKAGVQLRLPWNKHLQRIKQIQGWNYLHLVARKPIMNVHECILKSTCGRWPQFAHDINAVVFFADNLNDVIQPATGTRVCRHFRNVPRKKDYLTISVAALDNLLSECSLGPYQGQLTPTGTQWQSALYSFLSCPKTGKRYPRNKRCGCGRIQEFIPRRRTVKCTPPIPLPLKGAAIYGGGPHYERDDDSLSELSAFEVDRSEQEERESDLAHRVDVYSVEDRVPDSNYAEFPDTAWPEPGSPLYNMPNIAIEDSTHIWEEIKVDHDYNWGHSGPSTETDHLSKVRSDTGISSSSLTLKTSKSSRTEMTSITRGNFGASSTSDSCQEHQSQPFGLSETSHCSHVQHSPNSLAQSEKSLDSCLFSGGNVVANYWSDDELYRPRTPVASLRAFEGPFSEQGFTPPRNLFKAHELAGFLSSMESPPEQGFVPILQSPPIRRALRHKKKFGQKEKHQYNLQDQET